MLQQADSEVRVEKGGMRPGGRKPHHVNSRVHEQTKKKRHLQTDQNQTLWGDKCPKGRQKKVGKVITLQSPNVTCCSLCPHYNKISLADKKFTSCTEIMTLLIKAKKRQKIPPP